MSYAVKYSTSGVANTIRKGNIALGTNDVDYGPTASTDFWNGGSPPVGGYIVYHMTGAGSPSVRFAADDNELIVVARNYGYTGASTIGGALTYFAGLSAFAVVNRDYEAIVTSGLQLNLDGTLVASMPKVGGTASTWWDISGNGYNGTLSGATYDSTADGNVTIGTGTSDLVTVNSNSNILSQSFTWQIWHYYLTNTANSIKGVQWSEFGSKNYLWSYQNINSTSVNSRFDTSSQSFTAGVNGTTYNGFTSTVPAPLGRWVQSTLTFNGSGAAGANGVLNLYWNNVLMWNVSNVNIPLSLNTSVTTTFGNKNDGTFVSNMRIGSALIYNRVLTAAELTQNYNALKGRYGL